MKRTVLFGAMVLLLVLTFVTGITTPAWAYESCSVINGTPCTPGSPKIPCTTEDQFDSSCRCFQSHWVCML